MIVYIDKNSILSLFKADSFELLESNIDDMSPSLVEYHLDNFIENSQDNSIFLNKKDVQNCISFGAYSIYLDYNENIYLESSYCEDSQATQSFW